MKLTISSAILIMTFASAPVYAAGFTSQTGNAGVGIEGTQEGTARVTDDTTTTDTDQKRGNGKGRGNRSK
jgi:hypothetical protein